MNCDALVIGGGPAGSSAALLLARAGWSVVLVERKAFPRRKVCGEYLSATNLPFFDELGIGDRFRALAGPPVTTVGLFAGRTIAHAPLPTSRRGEFGRALAREHLDGWLTEQARSEGADVRHGWTLDDLSADGDRFVCPVRTVDGPA
ncbi:MAG: FAD-dependent monooxygenase, partial [Planctomycetes bacterium]|nr:FAD-dependent monooxygenase [Planctomycetota bacterium]